MFLTARVRVCPPDGHWCRTRHQIARHADVWSQQIEDPNDADEVRNVLHESLDCSSPHVRLYGPDGSELDGHYTSLAWYDQEGRRLILAIYFDADDSDDLTKFDRIFTLPEGTPVPTSDQCAFVVLAYNGDNRSTYGVAVMPIGEHIWTDFGSSVPESYRNELLALVA